MWRFYSQPITYAGRRYYLTGPAQWDASATWPTEVEIDSYGLELTARVDDATAPTAFEINRVGYVAYNVGWVVQLWIMTAIMFGSATAMLAYGAIEHSLAVEIIGAVFFIAVLNVLAVALARARIDAARARIGSLVPMRTYL
jgi:hypothetical protein